KPAVLSPVLKITPGTNVDFQPVRKSRPLATTSLPVHLEATGPGNAPLSTGTAVARPIRRSGIRGRFSGGFADPSPQGSGLSLRPLPPPNRQAGFRDPPAPGAQV